MKNTKRIHVKLCDQGASWTRGVGGGGGGGGHTVSQAGYLHIPLQMLGPESGVCNYLALEKINDMLILWIRAFSPPKL